MGGAATRPELVQRLQAAAARYVRRQTLSNRSESHPGTSCIFCLIEGQTESPLCAMPGSLSGGARTRCHNKCGRVSIGGAVSARSNFGFGKKKLFGDFTSKSHRTDRERIFWGQPSCSHGRERERESALHCGGSHRNEQTEFLFLFGEIRNRRKEAVNPPVMVFPLTVHPSGLASVLSSLRRLSARRPFKLCI